ncbi:RES family NAD+ phosphorylase [Rhodococcus sp. NPDC060086]|uniref:RES family NAD+ phosphorylase n=1 Tax=Rhodococcus sp. NPDC060086 TaxID=3347055 RepID=UPI00365EE8FD
MSAPRARQHLKPPPSPDELRGRFPEVTLAAHTTLYRNHAAGLGAWWFSSNGAGRFDLAGSEGTCYAAESELVTVLEAWSGIDVIPRPDTAKRDISAVTVHGDLRLADATSNRAIQFGVTAEMFTTSDYPLTQQWSKALRRAGFDGIRYWARHDLTHVDACIAVFAPSGDHTSTAMKPSDFGVLVTENLLDRPDLWKALEHEAGIVVLDIPGSL